MGLRETVQNAAKAAVAATGNIAVDTRYRAFSSVTANVSAGTDTIAYATTSGVKVIFEDFRLEQVDGRNVRPEDKRALVPAKSIPTVTPDTNDQIFEIDTSATWNVMRVGVDPAGALYELQVRRP